MKILCAGPTSINEKVLAKMSLSKTNPDLDPDFKDYYESVTKKYNQLINTRATSFFMLGEAIISLEAAICSLMEKDERVLVIYNGFFGEGFADYVESFGGKALMYKDDFRRGINIHNLEEYLEKDHDFALATLVHCETPSGISNDIKKICTLLNKYGILSVVDSVSGVGGEYVDFDEFKVDVLLCGSQKCLSAPAGMGMVTLSERAKEKIENRKSKIPSYYMNFANYYFNDLAPFPYTMNENLIYALEEAIDQALSKDFTSLHAKYAEITRQCLTNCGLELYAKDSFSNTVTAVINPEGIESESILARMRERNIAISKGVGYNTEKIFRIGHMGNNIDYDDFVLLFKNLDEVFAELGVELTGSLEKNFINLYNEYKTKGGIQ
ncbi:MAG: alanine--glyoxylate aminotransferase family protein [Peptoniphilus sp.]|nr:alanine--glyoxylate aminotransferase family protein [Peptoniphilus sp.]